MIVIALGANLPSSSGPPSATLHAALHVLEKSGVTPVACSRFFQSPAWPNPLEPSFVNAAALVECTLSPMELLNLLHAVETSFGRTRSSVPEIRNAPRTLDLDLIDFDGLVQEGPPVLPHPRMAARGFVLLPLRDIAPGWRHPESGRTLDALIDALGPEADLVTPTERAED
jgi:2-amino-4-hydroxy-6-hydroxymethyldihydropteridine diphosphokinase